VTRVRRRLELLREEHGYSLIELLTSMVILLTVMAGLTQLIVAGTRAEVDMNRRFQAQTQARLALDRLRKDVHGACKSSAATNATSVTLTYASGGVCPSSGGTQITYCVSGSAGAYELRRYVAGSCTGSYVRIAQYLTTQGAFTYTTPTGSLAKISVTLAVNLTPSKPERVYRLQDDLVLRNSTRA